MASANIKIPDFEHTPLEVIPQVADKLRATFRSTKTKDIQFRLVQLRKLYWAIKDYTPALCDALKADLRKSKHESLLVEVDWSANDCLFMIKNLERFAKDESDDGTALSFRFMRPHIRKEPMGMVLIISAYNCPVMLALGPLIGAIAAGCTAVLKPSEGSPHVAAVLKAIVDSSLDPSVATVVNGAVPETQALLDVKWDKIVYTGGHQVGKIIAQKAAETLTPITLELGGLNPAFVTKNANPKLAARRLAWGKVLNAGQICISQNYTLADQAIVSELIAGFKQTLKGFFPSGARHSPDYARLTNTRHFQRIKKILESTEGEIVHGGSMDEEDLFIEPTVILVKSKDDPLIREESFGPLIPILPYNTLEEAIDIANEVCETPLSLLAFGNDQEAEKILHNVTSGGATVNDSFTHASIPTLPFGGVGQSGTGAYRGRASFDVFTHRRSVAKTPSWLEGFLRVRYMPYKPRELARFNRMNGLSPDFDRAGRQSRGLAFWLSFLFGRSTSVKGFVFRWAVIFAGIYFARQRGYLLWTWQNLLGA